MVRHWDETFAALGGRPTPARLDQFSKTASHRWSGIQQPLQPPPTPASRNVGQVLHLAFRVFGPRAREAARR